MINSIGDSIRFMSRPERYKWLIFTLLRGLMSVLDLAGILAIGFIASSSYLFLVNGSDSSRKLEFFGFILPAVNSESLPWISAFALLAFLIKSLLSVLLTRATALLVARVEARAARVIAARSLGGDLSGARVITRDELIFAVQSGSPAAFNMLLNTTSTIFSEVSLFVVVALAFLLVSPAATLAALIYFAIVAWVMQFFVGQMVTRAGELSARGTLGANTAISDLMSVFRELLVLRKRDVYLNRIFDSRLAASRGIATQYYLGSMPRHIIEAALLIGILLFILANSLTGDLLESTGTIAVFLAGGFRLTAAMIPLQAALLTAKGAIAHARSALDLLSNFSEGAAKVEGLPADLNAAPIKGPIGLSLKGVSYRYSSLQKATIENISIDIPPGSQVAIIGPSGSGKSTLADVLSGALTPESGILESFTASSEPCQRSSYSLAYVPQRPSLVSGSIAQNIALGEPEEDMDRLKVASSLETAGLSVFIGGLTAGIDTDVGKLNDGLSGGQIQRLGLARALYTKPDIIIMDEATSALDAESEYAVRKSLDNMRGRITIVMIAHRLHTVQHSDHVFLMDEGRVVDQGKFQELVRRNSSISRLVELMKVGEA